MALRLYHEDIRNARFSDTIMRVLTEPAFRLAVHRISVKLRARPRTPTQEAAGETYNQAGYVTQRDVRTQEIHTEMCALRRP